MPTRNGMSERDAIVTRYGQREAALTGPVELSCGRMWEKCKA